MSELESLTDAATRRAADDIQLIFQKNLTSSTRKTTSAQPRFIAPPLPDIAMPLASSFNSAQTSMPRIPNSVPRLLVGRLSICAKWMASSKSS
jgi:hypothetical protein